MATRQQQRAKGRAQQKIESRPKVYLPVPDEFLDVMDQPWSVTQGGIEAGYLPAILMHTVRSIPVKTGNDSIRTLDCFQAIKNTPDGVIEMPRDDWDWMLSHFKDGGHMVWKAPDAAYLVRYLEKNVLQSPPEPSG